jgi:hypothetical protein
MAGIDDSSKWTALLPGFIVAGAGVGVVNPNLAQAAIGVVHPRQSGMASGINSTFRQIGIATGIAALGAIFQSHIKDNLTAALAGTPAASHADQIAHGVSSGGVKQVLAAVPRQARATVEQAANHSFVSGLSDLFLIAAVIAFVGAVLALALVRQSDFIGHARQGQGSGGEEEGAAVPAAV